jgi:hypothetical protein
MRTTNRILSIVLALVLLVGGLVLAIEAGTAVNQAPGLVPRDRWYAWARDLRLDSTQFLTISAVVAAVGLILLVLQLHRWPPDRVQTDNDAGTPIWISRASVERRVDAAAERVGVRHARCTVRGRPARWRLRLRGVAGSGQSDAVLQAVRAELSRLCAPPDTDVRLALRMPSRGAR